MRNAHHNCVNIAIQPVEMTKLACHPVSVKHALGCQILINSGQHGGVMICHHIAEVRHRGHIPQ